MADREKVIKGLECCIYSDGEGVCPDECPYYTDCWDGDHDSLDFLLKKDALELLKEQEPVKPIKLENWWKCPSCSGNIVYNMKYCPGCGKKVKWDG